MKITRDLKERLMANDDFRELLSVINTEIDSMVRSLRTINAENLKSQQSSIGLLERFIDEFNKKS